MLIESSDLGFYGFRVQGLGFRVVLRTWQGFYRQGSYRFLGFIGLSFRVLSRFL